MRTSKKTMLAALGFVLLGIITLMVSARLALDGALARTGSAIDDPPDLDSVPLSPNLTGFSDILIRDSWRIELVQGPDWDVELDVPENRIDTIEYGVRDGVLILTAGRSPGFAWWQQRSSTPKARITLPTLGELQMQGASNLSLTGFSGDHLVIDVAGATNLTGGDGQYQRLELTVNGASNIEFEGMWFVDAKVQLSGASNVELQMAGGELTGTIEGFANLNYTGAVSREAISVDGFASVQPD